MRQSVRRGRPYVGSRTRTARRRTPLEAMRTLFWIVVLIGLAGVGVRLTGDVFADGPWWMYLLAAAVFSLVTSYAAQQAFSRYKPLGPRGVLSGGGEDGSGGGGDDSGAGGGCTTAGPEGPSAPRPDPITPRMFERRRRD